MYPVHRKLHVPGKSGIFHVRWSVHFLRAGCEQLIPSVPSYRLASGSIWQSPLGKTWVFSILRLKSINTFCVVDPTTIRSKNDGSVASRGVLWMNTFAAYRLGIKRPIFQIASSTMQKKIHPEEQ